MLNERVRGFAQLLGTNVITKSAWALTLFLLLHKLGPQRFGLLATLWSISTIVAGGTDLGTGQALLREASRAPQVARHLARQSAGLQIITSTALGLLVAAGAWRLLPADTISGSDRVIVILLSVLTPFIDRFQTLFTICSQVGGNYSIYSKVRSTYFMTLLIAMVFVIRAGASLVVVSEVYFALTLFFSILMGLETWKLLPQSYTTQKTKLRSLVLHGIPFLCVAVLTLAYGRAEVSILGGWNLFAAAGAYHIIYQLILVTYSISGIFFTVVSPRLYKHLGNQEALRSDYRDTARWLSLLAWLVVPPLILYPKSILQLIGGTPLIAYAPIMQVLSLLILFAPASAGLNFLLPLDMLHARIRSDTLGVSVTILIVALAAATRHPLLAAIGAVVGYSTSVIVAQYSLRRRLYHCTRALLLELGSAGWRALVAALSSWLMPFSWWTRILIFVTIYISLLMITSHPAVKRIRDLINTSSA